VTPFQCTIYQSEWLATGASEVNAIVTIEASGIGRSTGPVEAAEVVILDVSGSMGDPPTKLSAARHAAVAAVDCIRDGVPFGIVAGSNQAMEVYPANGRLAVASDATRAAAKEAVARLQAAGGTAIGSWLRLADELLAGHPDAIRHAILLTDGRNEHEKPKALTAALRACEGHFTCDCRGVGADWSVDELRTVSSALLGTLEHISKPEDMAADFAATMRSSLSKAADDVRLRVSTPQGVRVRCLQQVFPTLEDLTTRRVEVDERTGEYPTPPWGDETREYHVQFEVPPREVGEEIRVARIGLVVGSTLESEEPIRAVWTDEEPLYTTKNERVDHYVDEIDKATAFDDALKAYEEGDLDTATKRMQRVVELAVESGDQERLAEVEKYGDVDRTNRTVALRADLEADELISGRTRSTKTKPLGKQGSPAP
jgi:hypothetical protein